MKLYSSDGSELMDVTAIRSEGGCLIIKGKIMGAMPIQAVLKPAELRSGFKLISVKTIVFLIGMLFRK
jgi:hypothetical protein